MGLDLVAPGKIHMTLKPGSHLISNRDGDAIGLDCGLGSGIILKILDRLCWIQVPLRACDTHVAGFHPQGYGYNEARLGPEHLHV